MYPATFAAAAPDRAAVVMAGSGEIVTYRELRERSNRFARFLDDIDPGRQAVVAILMANDPRYFEIAWAVRQTGRYFTPVNSHLTADEVAYIVADSGASVLVAGASLADVAAELTPAVVPAVAQRVLVGGSRPGWSEYADVVAGYGTEPVPDEVEGEIILYSSGTTGRPKGIRRRLSGRPMDAEHDGTVPFLRAIGFEEGGVYLCLAPLYHAAPIHWSMATHRLGGTVVVLERFDAEDALRMIERYRVTHANLVPTMFVRMLKLDPAIRARYDVSSLRQVVHAAAPCPVDVKRAMIEWWGPIISEFWSSSEGAGATFVTAPDWLAHPGTVGRATMGTLHVLDDDGVEVPPGEVGTIWAADVPRPYEYLNDEDKTRTQSNDRGWVTVGDVGYLDGDGYLYLTDRKAYTIIAGGVNVYPQEAEDVLIGHPKVRDAAVFGIPDPDLGERVHAVVEPLPPASAGPELAAELIAYCRDRLAHYKCPRGIDFTDQLPRTDTGKLYKRRLKDEYWARAASATPP